MVGLVIMVVAEDIFLDGLVHVSAEVQEIFRVVPKTVHFFDSHPVAHQPFLVSHVAFLNFLMFLALFPHFFLQSLLVLCFSGLTSRSLANSSRSSAFSAA